MSLSTKLVLATSWYKYHKFLRDTECPEEAQALLWDEICSEISSSLFWKEKFSGPGAPPLADFPITTYETYRAALERSFEKGINELSGKSVLFWAESAGTSGKPKRFPITPLQKEQFQRTTPPLVHSFARRFPGFLSKPVLYFAATSSLEKSPSGVDVGFISNFNYINIPRLLQKKYAFPIEIFKDSATFFKWSPVYALATDLSAMVAVTPSQIVLFAKNIADNIDKYWSYLEGKENPPPPLPPIKASPSRISMLKRALAKKDYSFKDAWPTLQFICCWKASTCGMQARELDPFLKNRVPIIDATYSATEGWINVPLNDDVGGPLHPGSHIFEFCKASINPEPEKLLPCWKLQPGEDYEIFLTTAMGFIRYRLFDVIRCTGYFNKTPIIEFKQKAGNAISLGLVQISENEIVKAMEHAHFYPGDKWFFGPNATGNGLVFYHGPTTSSDPFHMNNVHEELMKLNPYYDSYVHKGLVKPLASQEIPEAHWGHPAHGQTKPRVLIQSPPKI